ncbi:hypothetical protein F0562_022944 [Nyssa sinensis]|uniref:Uncharacterized protein n=1 Tax=Nyssa sinensis TaxID=561372 RepID=A0A5J5BJ59_9ASTE|nr:hypothetical protein F0562_022944 [Nyssa sinensis]
MQQGKPRISRTGFDRRVSSMLALKTLRCHLNPSKKAFIKAATAVGSRAASIMMKPTTPMAILSMIHGLPLENPQIHWSESRSELDLQGPCAAKKSGGLPEVLGDEVEAGSIEAEESVDKVVGQDVLKGAGEACVDRILQIPTTTLIKKGDF